MRSMIKKFATKELLDEIGIALGQWKFITDAEYAGIQVMGGNKSATHPMLRGQRTSLVMNDVKFIEHYGDQV